MSTQNHKQKLNQIIAIEKGVKSRVKGEQTEIYKAAQKPTLFDGFTKTYSPRTEDEERQPPQSQRVQKNAVELLRQVGNQLSELFDVTAAKDYANCHAAADVVVDGTLLLEKAPVTFLLFVEKELTDLHTFVSTLPTLDPAEDWSLDAGSSLYKTPPTETSRTRKLQKPIVLYPHSEEHPAQTQLITEDVTVGHWVTVKLSGALPEQQRKNLLAKIEKLQKAVKFAREEANNTEAPEKMIGEKLFNWLLS
jgi:hypothetical protein